MVHQVNWPELLIGGVLGVGLTLLGSWAERGLTRMRIQKKFGGKWYRTDMNEYTVKPENRYEVFGACLDLEIDIVAKTFRSLEMRVKYDSTRGLATAIMEVRGDQLNHVEGPYSYVVKTDRCYGDAGWFRVHLAEPDVLYVYYEGLGPKKHVAGYEIWKRNKQE